MTIREKAKELNIKFEFEERENTKEDIIILTSIISMKEMDAEIGINELLLEDDQIMTIIKKRLECFNIEHVMTNKLMFLTFYFNLLTPGKLILFIIELKDFYDERKRVPTVQDVCIEIFPRGFYSQKCMSEIINKILKPKLCDNAYIY